MTLATVLIWTDEKWQVYKEITTLNDAIEIRNKLVKGGFDSNFISVECWETKTHV